MSRVFITGSADGLGLMAARRLIGAGHQVVLHARSDERAADAWDAAPGAEGVMVGDLASIADIRSIALMANVSGRFDAVIHNAGVGYRERGRIVTEDGLSHVFAINVLAPYLLTAMMTLPDRLIYLSSGMHLGGQASTDDLQWERRRWNGAQAYSDSKLFDATLSAAVARRCPAVRSNAVSPGWVATKMGGAGAPDDLSLASVTQSWLAVSDDPTAAVSGHYFFHQEPADTHPAVHDEVFQEALLAAGQALTGETIGA